VKNTTQQISLTASSPLLFGGSGLGVSLGVGSVSIFSSPSPFIISRSTPSNALRVAWNRGSWNLLKIIKNRHIRALTIQTCWRIASYTETGRGRNLLCQVIWISIQIGQHFKVTGIFEKIFSFRMVFQLVTHCFQVSERVMDGLASCWTCNKYKKMLVPFLFAVGWCACAFANHLKCGRV